MTSDPEHPESLSGARASARWTLPLFLALAGCPGGHDAADAGLPCDVTMELAVRDGTGAWIPAATATHGQLVQGFQGFRYVYVRARVGAPPPEAIATAATRLENDPARSQILGLVTLTPDGDAFFTQALQVFFNDDTLAALVGHSCRITLMIGDPDGTCVAFRSAEVTLDYDPSCVEGPDGTPTCTDAGVP